MNISHPYLGFRVKHAMHAGLGFHELLIHYFCMIFIIFACFFAELVGLGQTYRSTLKLRLYDKYRP